VVPRCGPSFMVRWWGGGRDGRGCRDGNMVVVMVMVVVIEGGDGGGGEGGATVMVMVWGGDCGLETRFAVRPPWTLELVVVVDAC
jgi:hypothetical protein